MERGVEGTTIDKGFLKRWMVMWMIAGSAKLPTEAPNQLRFSTTPPTLPAPSCPSSPRMRTGIQRRERERLAWNRAVVDFRMTSGRGRLGEVMSIEGIRRSKIRAEMTMRKGFRGSNDVS